MPPDDLFGAARVARERAYAVYSGYPVGAAVRDEQGRIHAACNVENASYGLSICAERAAVFRMVAEGGTAIHEVAILTIDGGSPCGACLQVLMEFVYDPALVLVHRATITGAISSSPLAELAPDLFRLGSARRA